MKLSVLKVLFFLSLCSKSYSQDKKVASAPLIVFNSNTSTVFTSNELNKLKSVYGAALQTEILERPTRVLAMKEILRNRVLVKEVSDPKNQKPCPLLSEVPLFDVYAPRLKTDAVFNPSTFNPLKYDFQFHKPGYQMFRVDGSNYFIIIKPQHYNSKL